MSVYGNASLWLFTHRCDLAFVHVYTCKCLFVCMLKCVCVYVCVCFRFFPEKLMYGDAQLRRIYVLFLPFNISCLCLPLEAVMSTEAAFSSPQEQWSVEPGY